MQSRISRYILSGILPFVCVAMNYGAESVRTLPRPVVSVNDIRGTIWNLSADCDGGAEVKYEEYGDSLYSETFEGQRNWYLVKGDTTCFIKEESKLMNFAPFEAIHQSEGSVAFQGRGTFSHRQIISEEGVLERSHIRHGRLVLFDNDTLKASLISEVRRFKALIEDSISDFPLPDSLEIYEFSR